MIMIVEKYQNDFTKKNEIKGLSQFKYLRISKKNS